MTALRWPHGKRAACAFTFDLDAETLWLARGVNEPVILSQGTFGVLEALPRILDLLRQAEIVASFFVPAWVAEHHPDAVKSIVAGGHEVGCHGDVHEKVSDLDAAQEEKILVRSMEVLTRQAGRRPVTMDRLRPYLHAAAEGRRLVEIPVSWVLDDAPFFMFTGQRAMQPPGPVLQSRLTELEGITEIGGVTNFTFHPQIIGRPSRFACLRELVEYARRMPTLWLARLDAIAAHARQALA
jgi:peptidoglycan/xylan/chitin deacetylase (PgdA/CDA1 family)